uniref:Uncharacterized protein n=1 Tax=Anopheles coluzzii TaxID=1518534 RepID=A0A8W7PS22_ANOCL
MSSLLSASFSLARSCTIDSTVSVACSLSLSSSSYSALKPDLIALSEPSSATLSSSVKHSSSSSRILLCSHQSTEVDCRSCCVRLVRLGLVLAGLLSYPQRPNNGLALCMADDDVDMTKVEMQNCGLVNSNPSKQSSDPPLRSNSNVFFFILLFYLGYNMIEN